MLSLLLKTRRSHPKNSAEKGFTLIELLIVVLIAGGIISGLMAVVVELLTADQKEASRTQTQQEMQMAMDYISAELRQAVYIYDESCLSGTANGAVANGDYCPGLTKHLPAALSTNGSTPILAFWKQQQLPELVRDACGAGTQIANTPCIAGHAYSLVVYSLKSAGAGDTWDGQARITRYALNKYTTSSGSYANSDGYVDPGAFGNAFRSWPYFQGTGDATKVNKQDKLPTGQSDVLVDFVDNKDRGAVSCPTGYDESTAGAITGFYACVRNGDGNSEHRDVIVSLRGNASGRPSISGDNAFLPMLETRVLSRPILEKLPSEN